MKYSFYPKLLVRTPARPYSHFSPEHLREALRDKDFQQALLMASTDLYNALKKNGFVYELLTTEHRVAVFKYYNRMSYRATPFGAFASVSMLSWGQQNRLLVRSTKSFLMTFQNFGGADPIHALTEETLIYANPSVYKLGNQFRYLFRQRSFGKGRSTFKLMKVYKSRLLARLLKFLKQPSNYKEVFNFLTDCLQENDRSALIIKLIKAQVLYHSALPRITGCFLQTRSDQVITNQEFYSIAFHKQQGSLPCGHQDDILEGLKVLDRLAVSQEGTLSQFAEKFMKRFENTEVPLLLALDPQYGISYLGTEKSGIEDDDLMRFSDGNQRIYEKNWTEVSALLLQKMSDPDNRGPVSISEDDINRLPADNVKHFPPSLWIMFQQSGPYLFIENAGGNSAVSISGRFSHHPQILDELRVITALEQAKNPEVVFAEIAAMDDSVSDNINSRGHLRDFEIPVLVHSGLPQKRIISLSDLHIKVVAGQVIMRSKRLNKIVVPRLASAYNYKLSNLPLLRFLGDLQYQHLKCDFSFDPEFYLPGLRYYPRVMYKNIILSAAKWIWDKNVINDFADSAHGLASFHKMASSTQLVRWFALTSYDRQLVFDLNCEESIWYFLQIIKNQSQVILREFFLPGDSSKVYDLKGNIYLGQYIAFLMNEESSYQPQIPMQADVVRNVKTAFFPGEEWLYFKIYAHPETVNLLLSKDSLYRILQRFRKRNAIYCWFFVRYADPDHHLRLRMRTNALFASEIAAAINRMIKRLFKNGLIADFIIASYQPELERYGFAGMEKVEGIFELSSDAVLSFHQVANTLEDRICFAFSSVAQILSAILPALNERLAFSENMRKAMMRTAEKQVKLDNYYRKKRHQLELAVKHPEKYFGCPVASEIRKLQEKCKAITDTKLLVSQDRYNRFVSDLIHMHLNRINAAGSPEFDRNVYYLLRKYYYSLNGREKQLSLNMG
ncbi:lantibiotic dehydratase [Pedobacter ginsengisoli]|nr:lantibiotic dehydratase [Pedobacter ginsengisoli]